MAHSPFVLKHTTSSRTRISLLDSLIYVYHYQGRIQLGGGGGGGGAGAPPPPPPPPNFWPLVKVIECWPVPFFLLHAPNSCKINHY